MQDVAKPASQEAFAVYWDICLASLSFASGCTDVLTFLKLGNVFTSAMTGNTALLAIEIGRSDMAGASRALMALLAFTLGVALAARISTARQGRAGAHRAFRQLLLLELIFLTACVLLWSASPDPVRGAAVYGIILLSAISMGIQALAAGSIHSGINTIVFTSVLVRAVASIAGALSRPSEASPSLASVRPDLGTFAAYVCGALLASTLAWYFFRALIWVPVAAVVCALAVSELAGKLERSNGW
jgi:uncharacterized membrane protein YoaK (UPF0700 family)